MWFFRGKPENLRVNCIVNSCDKGYQEMSISFLVNGSNNTKDDQFYVGIPYPLSPNKQNGGFSLTKLELNLFERNENTRVITNEDITFYENPRKLKENKDLELVHIQDLCEWHVDDMGVVCFWVKNNEWNEITYRHKISNDSMLFVPTRLPIIIANSPINVVYNIWLLNGKLYNLQKHLNKVSCVDGITHFTISNWTWDFDTKFHSDNWESSDDDN
jgi:hypothetical protein